MAKSRALRFFCVRPAVSHGTSGRHIGRQGDCGEQLVVMMITLKSSDIDPHQGSMIGTKISDVPLQPPGRSLGVDWPPLQILEVEPVCDIPYIHANRLQCYVNWALNMHESLSSRFNTYSFEDWIFFCHTSDLFRCRNKSNRLFAYSLTSTCPFRDDRYSPVYTLDFSL